MEAHIPDDAQRPARQPARGRWWRVAAGAGVLLALSQTLWLWQTWPVRELLQAPVPSVSPVSGT